MATFDEESLLKKIATLYYNNLNNKLSAIDTDKDDDVTTPQLDVDNGIIYDLNAQDIMPNPFLWIYISAIESTGIGGNTLRRVIITPSLFYTDEFDDSNTYFKMLRYGRALREIAEENFLKEFSLDSITVESLPIVEFITDKKAQKYKVIGINIITTIA